MLYEQEQQVTVFSLRTGHNSLSRSLSAFPFNMRGFFFTPPQNHGGVIFSLQFVCVSVCVSVYVSGTSCEQNASQSDALIWTQFLLNGCFPNGSDPIEFGDLGFKVKVTVT